MTTDTRPSGLVKIKQTWNPTRGGVPLNQYPDVVVWRYETLKGVLPEIAVLIDRGATVINITYEKSQIPGTLTYTVIEDNNDAEETNQES